MCLVEHIVHATVILHYSPWVILLLLYDFRFVWISIVFLPCYMFLF